MKKLTLVQSGKNRSIVKVDYTETNKSVFLIVDNQYLLNLIA